MRAIISAPLVGLSLLGGCAQPQYLLSELPPTVARPANPNGVVRPHVALRIGNGFAAGDEAKIIAAVGDWNRNGAVRFDIAPQTYSDAEPGAWTILKPDPLVLAETDEWRVEPVAVTRRFSSGGGSIVVNVNRLGARDLRGIIVQQLRVASGGDDPAVSARAASASR